MFLFLAMDIFIDWEGSPLFRVYFECDDNSQLLYIIYLDIIYEFGSDWIILNREFMEYVTYGDDELIRGLRYTFNYSTLPCEVYYDTKIINS